MQKFIKYINHFNISQFQLRSITSFKVWFTLLYENILYILMLKRYLLFIMYNILVILIMDICSN